MAENQIRLSQLIGYYGPGAMLDLPDRSVLVMGLDDWDQRRGAFRLIEEPRLSRLLRLRLEGDSRLATSGDPQLRTPPLDVRDPRRPSPKIRATIFPRWFVCDTAPGDPSDRRRLVRFKQLEAPKRLDYRGDDGKRRRVSPIRFVCGCEDGHLQDVDWHRVVHQNAPGRAGCQEPLWLEDGGTTGDPRQTRVYCECGASLSLNDLFQPGRLGQCRGEWPWIDNGRDPNGCKHMLRLLTRSATNTYFPQVTRVISLPASVDQLAELVRSVWSAIQSCSSVEDVKQARRFNPQVAATLEGYPDDEVWARIAVMQRADGQQDQAENPRLAEFATLASGQAVIGTPTPDALLHAETLPRSCGIRTIRPSYGAYRPWSPCTDCERWPAYTALLGSSPLRSLPTSSRTWGSPSEARLLRAIQRGCLLLNSLAKGSSSLWSASALDEWRGRIQERHREHWKSALIGGFISAGSGERTFPIEPFAISSVPSTCWLTLSLTP